MSRSYDHGGDIFAIARRLGVAPEAMADFSASINPLGVPPLAREAIIATLERLVHYPDDSQEELVRALGHHHGLSPTNIIAANGSTELIYRLPALLPGRRALIVSPSFSEYRRALEQQQWEVRHFTLAARDGFALDTARLERALAEGYDALFLCNPGNPTGALYPQGTIERVCGICRDSDTFLVLDEAFMDFCEEASAKHVVAATEGGIVLRSMTKFFAIPGLRLGYAIGSETVTARLAAAGGPWSVSTPALAAGTASLQDAGYRRRTLAFMEEERCRLSGQLARFPRLRVYPSGANFLLVEITGGMTAHELRERLLAELIIIRDCASFPGLTPNFFRVAVRTRDENERLMECLGMLLNEG